MHKLILIDREGNLHEDIPLASISDLIEVEGNLLWLDILAPESQDYEMLREEFAFHPLALEDSISDDQRPKLDDYDNYLFIVSRYVYQTPDALAVTPLNMFVGSRYLVTIHNQRIPAIEKVISRWERYGEMKVEGVAYLLYAVLDSMLQDYFPLLDVIDDRMDSIEDRVLNDRKDGVLDDIFSIKKDVLMLRRAVSPMRDVIINLIRQENGFLSQKSRIYFSDVYDHIIHIMDNLDIHRDMVSGAMDAYLSTISNHLNDIMKVLTSLATIVGALTLISGIYGMNFQHMPELKLQYGYYYILGLMALTGIFLGLYFKKKEWL